MRKLALILLVASLACGSNGTGTPTTGGSGGAAGATGGSPGVDAGVDAASTGGAGSAGQGGADASADLARDLAGPDTANPAETCRKDSDCPPIQCLVPPCDPVVCVLGERGAHECKPRMHPAIEACQGDPCCRADSDCTMRPNGHCIPFSHGYCGGAAPLPGNTCRYDECTSDADCTAMPNGFCTASYERTCRYGPCRTNADCNRSPGGTCALATTNAGYCPRQTVICRYPTDPCRSDADCRGASLNGLVCNAKADGHGTMCVDRGPPPP